MVSYKVKFGDKSDAVKWLLDPNWLPFSFCDPDFTQYLEENYFTPGTPKNAEFETLMAHILEKGQPKIAFFFRIKNTPENRENLRVAIAEFYHKPLTKKQMENGLKKIRKEIRRVLPYLR